MNANRLTSVTSAWTSLCPPAQLYPIVMTALILFDVYRGTLRQALQHFVALLIGTTLLWILCAANLEVAAYALLFIPVVFILFVLAIILYDQTLFSIKHRYRCGCREQESCDECSNY